MSGRDVVGPRFTHNVDEYTVDRVFKADHDERGSEALLVQVRVEKAREAVLGVVRHVADVLDVRVILRQTTRGGVKTMGMGGWGYTVLEDSIEVYGRRSYTLTPNNTG